MTDKIDPNTFIEQYGTTISKAAGKWLIDHDCGSNIREKQKEAEHECFLYLMEDGFGKLKNIKDPSKTEQFIWICAYRRAGWFFMKEISQLLRQEELPVPENKSGDEALEDMKEAMETLDKRSVAIIKLYYFEGYGHDEIADELGISPGNAAVRLFRAVGKLKIKLKEMGYDIK